MKRIVLVTACLAAAVVAGYAVYHEELTRVAEEATRMALRAWDDIKANPVPVFLAVGTFLLTVTYHKAKGKSFRESVELAATRAAETRVEVVAAARPEPAADENLVVKRAKARAVRAQLLADQVGIENRQRKLPEELTKAEKEACYTEQAVSEAKQTLGVKHKAHNLAVAKLEALRTERAKNEAELVEIDSELSRLAGLV